MLIVVIRVLTFLCFLAFPVLGLVAFVTYLRRPGERTYNYMRYFYGEYRRTHPALFWGIFVALLLAFIGNVMATALTRAELRSSTTTSPAAPLPR